MATCEPNGTKMVRLAERRVLTQALQPAYAEGMLLIERVSEYLDGDGREDARALGSAAAPFYAAESMRLTTRLMQLASWLLLQRAAGSGDMSRDQVAREKSKLDLYSFAAQHYNPMWQELPQRFRDLVEQSRELEERVRKMDADLTAPMATGAFAAASNPVSEQIVLLRTAFANN